MPSGNSIFRTLAKDTLYPTLFAACRNGNLNTLELLISNVRPVLKEEGMDDIDFNMTDINGNTPLSEACRFGHTEIVKLLLQQPGIKVNQAINQGETALTLACRQGHADIVALLLNAPDIEVNQANDRGETPLSLTCLYSHLDTLYHLLQCRKVSMPHSSSDEIKQIIDRFFTNILNLTLEVTDECAKKCAVLLYIRGYKPQDTENRNLYQNWIKYEQTIAECTPVEAWNFNCAKSATPNLLELCIFAVNKQKMDVSAISPAVLTPPQPLSDLLDDFMDKVGVESEYGMLRPAIK